MIERKNGEKITLVGAGPVGSLLALFLSRRGFQVEIFERRPDMRLHGGEGGRSINLALSVRGLHALKQVGLEEQVLKMAIPMLGRMVHTTDGKNNFQRYGKNDHEYINSVSRGELNKLLLTEAEKTGLVRLNFDSKVKSCDFIENILEIEEPANLRREYKAAHSKVTLVEHKFMRVIGTDGSASVLRKSLQVVATHGSPTEEHLNYGYKELNIPPGPGGKFLMEKNALHIWPRGNYMLIALPNLDGSFTATLFLPHNGPLSFDSLNSEKDVQKLFEKDFGDVMGVMPNLAETFFGNPLGHMVTVKCTPWNFGDRALLLGDAAHAMVPFFGQGMNCGFEDCTMLDTALSQGSDWNGTFTEFSKTRKPHTDAISDMAVENFIEMRDKVANPQFLLEKTVANFAQIFEQDGL